jgi:hypothetical protein
LYKITDIIGVLKNIKKDLGNNYSRVMFIKL